MFPRFRIWVRCGPRNSRLTRLIGSGAYIPSTGYPGKSVYADDSVFDEQDHQNQVQSDEMKMEQILEEEATRKRILKYRRLSINS